MTLALTLKELHAELTLKDDPSLLSPDQQLTVEQVKSIPLDILYEYGFRNWNNEGLLLFPLWALHLLKDDESMYCIDKTVAIKGTDYIDNDTRGGVLAFGIIHPELQITK